MKPIKFKARDFEFEVIKTYWNDENLMIDDSFRAGITRLREGKIYLSNDTSPEVLKRVLLHEITHAFIFVNGMKQVNFTEEVVADFIESNYFEIQKVYEKVSKELLDE